MPSIPLPYPKSPVSLADWLELQALIAAKGNASGGDLERVLRREADTRDADALNALVREAFQELEFRVRDGGTRYPFSITSNIVSVRLPAAGRLPYVFCLCLSYFQWTRKKGDQRNPRHWFEHLSRTAAHRYLNAESTLMSPPRKDLPQSFDKAVHELCSRISEGKGWKRQPVGWNKKGVGLAPQDDAVDVVAWRHFKDRRAGKILMFGQCASGANWEDKITELTPEAFCSDWMIEAPPSNIIKAFFVPHRIPEQRWDRTAKRAGIVFDRCRIVSYIDPVKPYPHRGQIKAWVKETLRKPPVWS